MIFFKEVRERKNIIKVCDVLAIKLNRKWHNNTLVLLRKYLNYLNKIEKKQQENIINYYMDILLGENEEDRICFKDMEERWCKEIERRMGNKTTYRKSTI